MECDFVSWTAAIRPSVRHYQLPSILPHIASNSGDAGGLVDCSILKEIHLGELDGSRTSRLDRIGDAFRQARLDVDVRSDMLDWLWIHFAINAGVVASAIRAGGAGALLDDQVAAAIRGFYGQDRAARKIMEKHTATEDLVRIYQDVLETGRSLDVPMPHLEPLEPYVAAFLKPQKNADIRPTQTLLSLPG